MTSWRLLLLLVVALPAVAGIINIDMEIEFKNEDGPPLIRSYMFGKNEGIIADAEAATFGLTEKAIKDCIENRTGQKPTDVYLHSPTPFGDLYKTYKWRETQRIIRPIEANIETPKENSHSKYLTSYKKYVNKENGTGSFIVESSMDMKVKTTWEDNANTMGGGDIKMSVDLKKSIESEIKKSIFELKWNKTLVKQNPSKNQPLDLKVKPNSTLIVIKYLTITKIRAEIKFETTLSGNIAVNFNPSYKDHHFYRFNVYKIMTGCNLVTTFTRILYVHIEVSEDKVRIYENSIKEGEFEGTLKGLVDKNQQPEIVNMN